MTIAMTNKYKQTEIGLIPSDWEVKKFIDVTKIITCGLAATPKYVDESIGKPFLSAQNVQAGKVVYNKYRFIPKELFDQITKNNPPEKGDLLYTRVGAGIGEAGVIEDDFKFGIYVSLTLIRTDEKKLHNYYLSFLLNSPKFRFLAKNGQFAGGGVQNLNVQIVREFLIPLPPLSEQLAIATALSDADNYINALEKVIAKKRLIKQGAMQELLKPKEGWVVKKLGEIGECIIGLTYSPANVKESGTLVLRSSNIKGCSLKYDDNVYVDSQIPEKLINKENDILICVRNGSRDLIGKCALINGAAVGKTFGAFMSIYRSPYNVFVFHLFQSDIIKKQIDEYLGATINQITNKSLNSFEIPFPTIEEQSHFTTILSELDLEITKLEQKIDKANQIKQGMMQQLLTGRIRLV